jgi:two-component system chemotaxis response regulator CheY
MDGMSQQIKMLMGLIKVLIVDDEHYSRKVMRTLLSAIGVAQISEAASGVSGLDAIQAIKPNVVLLDWEMPGMDGPGFMRRVRAPDTFMYPDVPVIMISAHGEKSRVMEAVNLGVHEFLLKPVSSMTLLTRILGVIIMPRPMIRRGSYYGPEPRKLSTSKPESDQDIGRFGADAVRDGLRATRSSS